ncbi:MAG: porin family protein [Bacteroidota bacterium]|nr:porin family protein [Bacteroidota bacterium]MDP4233656.1 porin family protein [Bacteroidota bacterium]MDP4243084.1 porin family protein [Bacteroidota bacterium]MDP4288470.1 porin family protein [Bacteroidota bacterium]
MRHLRLMALGLFLLTIAPALASAQRYAYTPQPSTMIGVRGGLGIANEATPLYTNFTVSSHTGFLLGGQLDYWFQPQWALSVQLLYNQKGDHLDGVSPDNGLPETDDFTLGYIEIPVLAKIALGTSNVKPYFFAGPDVGILLAASDHQVQTSGGATYFDQTVDVSNSFNSLDLSLLFGAGVSYQMTGGPQLFLDAGYALGLVNVEKTAATGVNESLMSRDIRIAAGAMFPLQ